MEASCEFHRFLAGIHYGEFIREGNRSFTDDYTYKNNFINTIGRLMNSWEPEFLFVSVRSKRRRRRFS